MSDMTIAAGASAVRIRRAPQPGHWVKPLVALVAIGGSYHTSFTSLLEAMSLDTPLAHLALVPAIALGLAYIVRRRPAGPPIHDRQLDWIVGLPLVLLALTANFVLPARLSTDFWVLRVDLLTLPVFTAGVIALLFGVRTLWRFRLPVLFLFLAWPYPYNAALDQWLGKFTDVTVSALRLTLTKLPLATEVQGGSSVFRVVHAGQNVEMSVASACSGANGLVGFLLVGFAFVLVVQGPRKAKLAWMAMGAALVWVLNVVRILIIFFAAKQWGQGVAIDGFHPVIGLIVFNLAIVFMLVLMRPFRLSFGAPPLVATPSTATGGGHRYPALALVVVSSIGLGALNTNLSANDSVANSLGSPRLSSFAVSRETPDGWELQESATYDWARRFYGSDSNWTRYLYRDLDPGSGGDLSANIPITADVIDTSDRAALAAYGVESCYRFHGYSISGRQSVDLGAGIVGGMLTWTSSETDLTWTTLYWHWPIKTDTGTRYERVTLVLNDQPTNTFVTPPAGTDLTRQLQLGVNDALRGAGDATVVQRLLDTRTFMVAFARRMIDLRAAAA